MHLEMNQLGVWKPVRALRASMALLFPRSAGGEVNPVVLPRTTQAKSLTTDVGIGYVPAADREHDMMKPLVGGTFVYSPGPGGERGELLMVWHSFHPEEKGRELDELGEIRVSCAELLLVKTKGRRSTEYQLDKRPSDQGGSFANGGKTVAWEMQAELLWIVDHLVTVDAPLEVNTPSLSAASPRYVAAAIEKRRFQFDFKKAEAEIKKAKERLYCGQELGSEEERATEVCAALAAIDLAAADPEVADAADELAAARQSADEAAAMRTRPTPLARTSRERVQATPPNLRQVSVCRYAAQRCEGCNSKFTLGEKIVAGVRAMIHPSDDCLRMAKGKHEQRKASSSVIEKTGSLNEAKVAALKDGDRLIAARKCLNGECFECTEPRVKCLKGCGRGVHLNACLKTSANFAAAGRLICIECRLAEILEEGDSTTAPATLVQQVTLAMVAELTTGAISTAAGRSQFVSLERRWVTETVMGTEATVRLPRHSLESFLAFIWWLVTDADRARSFSTIMRAAGAVMSMLELNDWTKTQRVKSQVKDIERRFGVEAEPCTQTTGRIISIMLVVTIEKVCSKGASKSLNSLLQARTEVLLVLELLAGLRVGEATSSGDLHGLEANNVCFLRPIRSEIEDGLGETIELEIKDSKTGPGRHSAFVSKTLGPCEIPGGKVMRNWIKRAGLAMTTSVQGGFDIERPNYWVVRVNLSSMGRAIMTRFMSDVESTSCEPMVPQIGAICKYVKERYNSKNLGEEQRYVNVIGGSKFGPTSFSSSIAEVDAWLTKKGYSRYMTVVPGPFVRATFGKTLTHMPLATGSTYTHLSGAMQEAYEISSGMAEPDPELDLHGREKPKFSNHSLRRHSDKAAREALPRHEANGVNDVNKRLIDYFFGWLLKEMTKDMQLHYAGLDRPSRRALARVTMYL